MLQTDEDVRDALLFLIAKGYKVTNSHGGVVEECLGGYMHEGCIRRAKIVNNVQAAVDSFLTEEAEGLGDTPRGVNT